MSLHNDDMMIMRWCNVQTNEYDLQAKTYLTTWTQHKLRNDNENKMPVFPEYIYTISDRHEETSPARISH